MSQTEPQKYKLILKVKGMSGLPDSLNNQGVYLLCLLEGEKDVQSGTEEVVEGAVKWEKDNVLARATLVHPGNEVVLIKILEDKRKAKSFAKFNLNFAEYFIQLPPGKTSKFQVNQKLKSGISVTLSLAMKRDNIRSSDPTQSVPPAEVEKIKLRGPDELNVTTNEKDKRKSKGTEEAHAEKEKRKSRGPDDITLDKEKRKSKGAEEFNNDKKVRPKPRTLEDLEDMTESNSRRSEPSEGTEEHVMKKHKFVLKTEGESLASSEVIKEKRVGELKSRRDASEPRMRHSLPNEGKKKRDEFRKSKGKGKAQVHKEEEIIPLSKSAVIESVASGPMNVSSKEISDEVSDNSGNENKNKSRPKAKEVEDPTKVKTAPAGLERRKGIEPSLSTNRKKNSNTLPNQKKHHIKSPSSLEELPVQLISLPESPNEIIRSISKTLSYKDNPKKIGNSKTLPYRRPSLPVDQAQSQNPSPIGSSTPDQVRSVSPIKFVSPGSPAKIDVLSAREKPSFEDPIVSIGKTKSPRHKKLIEKTAFSRSANSDSECEPRPLQANTKYPSFKKGHLQEKKQIIHAPPTSVAGLKQFYQQQQQEADEKYLIENIIHKENSSTTHVIGYIIFKSLVHWDAFGKNGVGVAMRVISACEKAMKECQDSRTRSFQWFSNLLTMFSMSDEYDSLFPDDDSDIYFGFKLQLRDLILESFELVLSNLYQKVTPLLEAACREILPQSSSIIQEDTGPFPILFSCFQDYLSLSSEHCLTDNIRNQFYQRIFKFLATYLVELTSTSYVNGFQLKVMMKKLSEWFSEKLGTVASKLFEAEFEVTRQVAEVLNLSEKSKLADEEFRKKQCPRLRPAQIIRLLHGYRPDNYDKEVVTSDLLSQLQNQDSLYKSTVDSFDPTYLPQLDFASNELKQIVLEDIKLPKILLDRPGFSFLKAVSSESTGKLSANSIDGTKPWGFH
eukprot:TRINITY_DN9614_c0_g1_i1.p1 TRINITY_DN9614_c0_g1~~TRINITY_DN9614_c0_g1_i1.p1  ORF type:complete len:961 (-),score=222.84 TRINITY_DN9614_c0_g1_i1:134-2989(-)